MSVTDSPIAIKPIKRRSIKAAEARKVLKDALATLNDKSIFGNPDKAYHAIGAARFQVELALFKLGDADAQPFAVRRSVRAD